MSLWAPHCHRAAPTPPAPTHSLLLLESHIPVQNNCKLIQYCRLLAVAGITVEVFYGNDHSY